MHTNLLLASPLLLLLPAPGSQLPAPSSVIKYRITHAAQAGRTKDEQQQQQQKLASMIKYLFWLGKIHNI